MTIEHVNIDDPNIHEPKDISTQIVGKVYVSDGVGSGDWKYPGCHVYGNIYSKDSSITMSTIGTTAQKFTGFDADGPANLVTVSHSSDSITIQQTGVYKIDFTATLSSVAVGDAGTYQLHLRKNAVENAACGVRRYLSGSNDTGSLSFSGIVSLTAGDVLTVYIESDEAGLTDDITIHAASFTVFMLKAS